MIKAEFVTSSLLIFFISCGNADNQISQSNPEPTTIAQNEDSIKRIIDEQVSNIDRQSGKYRTEEKYVEDRSSEGETAQAYYMNTAIQKIAVESFGVMGKANQVFYFSGEKLIMAQLKDTLYDKPLTEPDRKIDTVQNQLYYFWGEALTGDDSIVYQEAMYYKKLF